MKETQSSPPRRRRRRWLLALILPPIAAAVVVALLTGTDGGRRWLLDRAAGALEDATGVRLTASEVDLDLRAGVVELAGVALSAGEGPPFLTVERARVDLAWRSLFADRVELTSVTLDAPALDLEAPLPPAGESAAEPGDPPAVDLRRVTITGGSVAGAPPDPGGWLAGYRAGGLELRGGYVGGEIVAELTSGVLTLHRSAAPGEPVELQLAAALRGPATGPFEVGSLEVAGPGLRLRASGTAGLGAGEPIVTAFDLTAQPARILPEVASGAGRVEAAGRLELPDPGSPPTGTVRLRASGFPPELLEPWLGGETLARLGAGGTHLDLDADLRLASPVPEATTGDATLVWRRGDEVLLRARVETVAREGGGDEPGDGTATPPLLVAVDAALLPGSAGERRVAGRLRAPGWAELAEARVEDGGITLAVPDLGEAVAELRARWPELVPAELSARPLPGPFEGIAELAGPLLDPTAEVRAEWRPGAGSRVVVTATGEPVARSGRARLELQGFDLALLGVEVGAEEGEAGELLRGRVDGTVTAGGAPGSYGGTATLEAAGVDAGPGFPTVDHLRLAVAADRHQVQIATLEARAGDRRLTAEGSADLPTPIAAAELHLVAEKPADGIERLELVAELTDGVVRLRIPEAVTDAGVGTAVARIPLASLGVLPGVRERLAGVPIRTAGGPILLDLSWPGLDSRTLLPLLGVEGFDGRVQGGVDLALDFDPAAPSGVLGRLHLADLRLELPRTGADPLRLEVADGSLGVAAEIDAGVLRLWLDEAISELGRIDLEASLPLGTLRALPPVAAVLDAWGIEGARGPLAVDLAWRDFDSRPLLALLDADRPERLTADLTASLRVDPDDASSASGRFELADLELTTEDHRVTAGAPLRLEFADRRLELAPVPLVASGHTLELAGEARVRLGAPGTPGTPLFDLDPGEVAVEELRLRAAGTIPASILDPYLGGGAATGPLHLDAVVTGPPDQLVAEVEARGPEVRLYYLRPYATQLTAPEVRLTAAGGEVVVESARGRLNEGLLELSGRWLPDGTLLVNGLLDAVRYRFDYGLSTVLSGNFELLWPSDDAPHLGANLLVERGVARRDLDVDRELLNTLFGPPELRTEPGPLDRMGLDLSIATVEGVRVKNNVADLRASWAPISVRGTLAAPIVEGAVDVEPGGRIYAYGQTLRLDQAILTFPGRPGVAPELELETTSSLEDPTVGRPGDFDLFTDAQAAEAAADVEAALASGVLNYYGERVASRLGQTLGQSRISIRPVLIFGEAEPEARLTVSSDLSPNVAFVLSTNLRQAEDRTYILELHELRQLPRFAAQLFTNDEGNYGTLLAQTFELGGGVAPEDENRPRIRRIEIRHPPEIRHRTVRRAVGFDKGDRLGDGADFDVEIDVTEALRRRGYPDPQVEVDVVPVESDFVELVVEVDPGLAATFEFTGERPPASLRRSITTLYRPDYYEPASLDEMRQQTVQLFRSLGYPHPEVRVEVAPVGGEGATADRRVTVHTDPGRRLSLGPPVVTGVPGDVAELLRGQLTTRQDRTELAAGLPSAEERLLADLRSLGYPEPRIEGIEIEGDDRLLVHLDPGGRQRIAELRIAGLPEDDRARLAADLRLAVGHPARADRLADAALRIERDLRDRGYTEARVRPSFTPLPDRPHEVAVELVAEPGRRHRLAEIRVEGTNATREPWVTRLADLEPGTLVRRKDVAEARRRLMRSGVFEAVRVRTSAEEDGALEAPTELVIDVEEKPRYRIAAGLRWENSEGSSAVADVVDRNFTGRGTTLGVRALLADDLQSLRLYSVVPRIFASRYNLELFAEGREERSATERRERFDLSGQLSRPIGDHTTGRVYGRYRVSELFREEPSLGELPREETRTPFLGLQLVYNRVRVTERGARRGNFASADLSGSGSLLGAEQSFLRLFAQIHHFRPLPTPRGRYTWAQSLRLGWADAFGEPLLEDLRFKAGGEYSVRGYDTEGLGPEDATGDPAGGEALLVLNQELHFPLWPEQNLTGLLFLDLGNVWEDPADLGTDLKKSLGVGLRAATAIGLLRLDLAVPLDRRDQDEALRVYVGFGQVF